MLYLAFTGVEGGSPTGPDWLLQGMILGEVLLLSTLAIVGYRVGKDQGWGRGLHGLNLLMAVAALTFFVGILKVETDAVFLALWPVIFVLLAYGRKGDSRFGAMKKNSAEHAS